MVGRTSQTVGLDKADEISLGSLIEHAPIGVYRSTPQGKVVFANPSLLKILGVDSLEELNRLDLEADLYPVENPRKKVLERIEREGKAEGLEFSLRRRDGNLIWVREYSRAVRGNDGHTLYYEGTLEDVTEQRKTADALRESESRLRDIVEHSTNLFYAHTADHVLTYLSPQTRSFLDCEPAEAQVRWTDFATDNPANERGLALTEKAIATGERQPSYQLELVGRKGRRLWVEVNEAPVVREGKTVAIVGALTDVTERKHAEEALRDSEERYRSLVQNAPDIIVTADLEGRIQFINRVVEGFSKDEVVGSSIYAWVADGERDRLRSIMQRVCASARAESYVMESLGPNGSRAWYSCSAAPTLRDGKVDLVTIIASDVTETKRAEAEVKKALSLVTATLESTADGILVVDKAGRITNINQKFAQMWRIPAEIISSRDDDRALAFVIDQLLDPEAFLARVRELYANPEAESYDVLEFKDGRVFERYSIPQKLGGEVVGRVWSFRDVTKRRRAEEEVRKLNFALERRVQERTRELEVSNHELEAFSSSVSHDLRAPLRTINGFSQALREDYGTRLDTEGHYLVDRIQAATRHMAALIDDLLRLSRVTRAKFRRELVDLSAVAQTVFDELLDQLPGRRVELVNAPGVRTQCDPHLVRIVLENLLSNALKFTGKKPTARIEFGFLPAEGFPVYFVRDDGAGFDMAHAAKLFTPFERLHKATEFEGTGIGLATVYRIIQRHGGKVWAEGVPDHGATLYFTLGGI